MSTPGTQATQRRGDGGGNHVDRTDLLRRTDLTRLLDNLAPPAEGQHRRRWRCPHPDHEDRHPSVSMRLVDGIGRWRCWSCGRGGTAIDALVAARDLTVGEAISHLAAAPHQQPISTESTDDEPVPFHPSAAGYAHTCHRVLWTRTGKTVLDWLVQHRHLSVDVLQSNLVGADPGPQLLRRRRGLPRSGTAAVLPAFDPQGRIVYLQARYLSPGPGPKYGNPARRLGSNPRLAWTRLPAPTHAHVLVVCEGILDALTVATAGVPAVAVLGATYPNLGLAATIAAHTHDRQVVIAFDGDDPGRIAADRLHHLLAGHGVDARVWDLPDATDLNTLAQTTHRWADRLTRSEGSP